VNKKEDKSTTFDSWKFFTKIGIGDDGKERENVMIVTKIYNW